MGSITLLGADDVRAAGSRIAAAADDMRQAALNFDGSVDRMRGIFDDFLQRLDLSLGADRTERGIAARDAVLETIPKPTTDVDFMRAELARALRWVSHAPGTDARACADRIRALTGDLGDVNVAAVPHHKLVEALKPFRSPGLMRALVAAMSERYVQNRGNEGASEFADDLKATKELADVMPALIALVRVGRVAAGVPPEVEKILARCPVVSVLFHSVPITAVSPAARAEAWLAFEVDAAGALTCTKNADGEI